MSGFKFDPSQPGLRKTLREWEELALRYIWENGEEGKSSRLIWIAVIDKLNPRPPISRTSIIFALNRFVDQGILSFRDDTGKGGHYKIYYPLMDEEGYKKFLLKTMVESMMRDFPEETLEVLREYS